MNKTKFIAASLFLTVLYNTVLPESLSAYQLLDSAKQLLIKQDYAGSHEFLKKYQKVNPSDFEAVYLSLAVDQTQILDYESYLIKGEKFQTQADSVRKILEAGLKTLKGKDSLECLFYIANVYGGISIMQAKTGEWFNSVSNAVTSVTLLKQINSIDSSFYAANLGIGVFDYYLSTSFKWLPFLENKELDGLQSIEAALKAPYPYDYAAKNSLCWIFAERKNFRLADSLAQSVLDKNPDNTIFLRIKTMVNFWNGKYNVAMSFAKKLIDLSEKRNPINWSDMVTGYSVLASCYNQLGSKMDAFETADTILNKNIPQEYCQIPHIKRHLKNLSNIRQRYRSFASR